MGATGRCLAEEGFGHSAEQGRSSARCVCQRAGKNRLVVDWACEPDHWMGNLIRINQYQVEYS